MAKVVKWKSVVIDGETFHAKEISYQRADEAISVDSGPLGASYYRVTVSVRTDPEETVTLINGLARRWQLQAMAKKVSSRSSVKRLSRLARKYEVGFLNAHVPKRWLDLYLAECMKW